MLEFLGAGMMLTGGIGIYTVSSFAGWCVSAAVTMIGLALLAANQD